MDAVLLLAAIAFAALALISRRIERDAQMAGSASDQAAGDPPPMRLALLDLSPAQFAALGAARADEAARLAAAARPPEPLRPAAPAPAEAA